ncbi:MAG TPA: ATP-binding protein [Terracidiphilus sp.]|nr:ATP-binding protein [Terracidiphilus sp.]
MSKTPRRRSISSILTWMNVLVSGIGLLLAYISFLGYNLYAYRQAAVVTLSGEAQIIASNSASAIIFNDPVSAQQTLSSVASSSDVLAAAVYTGAGTPFAQYVRAGAPLLAPRDLAPGESKKTWVDGLDLLTASRVVMQGKPLGTVYIWAHLSHMRRQATRYGTIAGSILLVCLGAALVVGAVFRRVLANPVVAFADTARLVTRYRDYSIRFTPNRRYKELLLLTDAFNEMLAEIQERDAALGQAKTELEVRVEDRTAQLQSANRELEAFSYTVAHDLRGPLQAIQNICHLIVEDERRHPSEAKSPMLSQLGASITAMSNTIDDLLDLSRSSSAALHLARLDLSMLVTSILDMLAKADPKRQVITVVQPRCFINGDPGLIQIALQNLLRNAWKFTGHVDPATIEFGATEKNGETIFYVRDNGAGFDPRKADRLFKPFQRLHPTTEFPGTGIGLATVQRIIRRHGGEVWAEGGVEKGATFYFTLDVPK